MIRQAISLLFIITAALSVLALGSATIALANSHASTSSLSVTALVNPLNSDIDSIEDLLEAILEIMLVLAVPIIVFFIIYAGFKYVMAQGKEEELQKANRMLLWSIVGGLIILGARVIFAVIKGTVDSFGD